MKLKALLVFTIAIFSCDCAAQLLSGDAQGKSAILFDANAINFDIAETALAFNINNFQKQTIAVRKQVVWGISAKGQNNEGIANLLSEGKFLPSGQVGMFIGAVVRGPKSDYETQEKIRKLRSSKVIEEYEALMNFKKTTDSVWKTQRVKIPAFRRKKMETDLKNAVNQDGYRQAINNLDILRSGIDNWKDSLSAIPIATQILNAKTLIDSLKSKLEFNYSKVRKPFSLNPAENLEIAYERESDALELLVHQESKVREESKPFKLVPYLSFGITGSKIKLYDKAVAEPYKDRFKSTPFTGVFTDLGVNFDLGKKSLFGLSAGFERANTIDSLTATDYTIRETEKSGNTELISEKKEKGYTGIYETFTRFNFRLDCLHPFQLGKKGQLIWNIPYARYAISDKKRAAINLLNIGTSANFFKEGGKFAGGVYLEVGDVLNRQYAYQLKLAPDQETRNKIEDNKTTIFKRITFGVVAKFAIQSIVDPFKW